jgi:copper chaperone CopZ
MKKRMKFVLIVLAFVGSSSAFAAQHGKEATFKVSGNCGMCEKKIEAAALSLKGVKSADWSADTKKMTVVYHEKLVNLQEIMTKIAATGYDTEGHTAPDAAYNSLPGCCQYER